MSTGELSGEVNFPSFAQSGIDPPNPVFLRVHGAFAKVMNLSGATEYLERVEMDAGCNNGLYDNRETDAATLLMSKLTLLKYLQI